MDQLGITSLYEIPIKPIQMSCNMNSNNNLECGRDR